MNGIRIKDLPFLANVSPEDLVVVHDESTGEERKVTAGSLRTAVDSSILQWGVIFSSLGTDPSLRKGSPRTVYREPFNVSNGNWYHLLSVRPRAMINGKPNSSWLKLFDINLFGTADGIFQVCYNAQPSNPNWKELLPIELSFTEIENESNSFPNNPAARGLPLYSGSITTHRAGSTFSLPDFREPLTAFSDGSESNVLSIAFLATSNGNMGACINFEEIE